MDATGDLVLPFALEGVAVRGRLVRLGGAITGIIATHQCPPPVARVLGEAVSLAALLGSALKFDGRLSVQTSGTADISMLVADFTTPAALRGYARWREDMPGDGDPGRSADHLGKGHMAITIDQGRGTEPYQGVVPLEGQGLAVAATGYFTRSEQLPTRISLAAAPIFTTGDQGGQESWRAGGLMLQALPGASGEAPLSDDDWRRIGLLLDTLRDDELLDPRIAPETLLYRLFHEDGVRVFDPLPLQASCACSREKIAAMLKQIGPGEPAGDEETSVEVKCEFCGRAYSFERTDFC
jgi:molecular chaperone Hsp33